MPQRNPAPFARHIRNGVLEVVVLFGSDAWRRAGQSKRSNENNETRWAGRKWPGQDAWWGRLLVCPPDSDPATIAWPVSARTALIVRCGETSLETEQRLAASLLRDGCLRAVVVGEAMEGCNVYA